MTFILFEFNPLNNNQVTQIYSPHPKSILLKTLSNTTFQLPGEIGKLIQEQASSSSQEVGWIEVPHLLQIEIVGRDLNNELFFKAENEKLHAQEKILKETVTFSPLPITKVRPTGPALIVRMAEFGILNPNNAKKYSSIGTFGIGSCVGVAIYDSQSKSVAVAHLDAITDVSRELSKVMTELDVTDPSTLQVWLTSSQVYASLMNQVVDFFRDRSIPIDRISNRNSVLSLDTDGVMYHTLGEGTGSDFIMHSISGRLRKAQ